VLHRNGDQVVSRAEVDPGLAGQFLSDEVEHLEIALGFPGRVDGRGEGVHERVHVGARQVVLLIPGGSRQHDVGEQRCRSHPEVGRQQQVELALRRLVMPDDVLRSHCGRSFLGHHVGVSSEQVLEEVLVALRRRAEQIRAPQCQSAWPVLRCIDILDRHLDRSRGHRIGNVRRRIRSLPRLDCALGLICEIQRIDVELRVERHPPQPSRLRDGIGGMHADQMTFSQR
jgi:hypothetical protein